MVENRKLVEEIFLAAVDLPPQEREAYVASACSTDEVAREVRSLLAYDSFGEASIESVVHQAAVALISADPLIGTRLGPYQIREELGKGGMGSVFLALRDDETFEKKVAVKVVKRGMDSAAVLERFRHERRILANLDHPYISRLIDAGTTPDGRPYFVMEYVEGQPIVAYCARNQLLLAERLDLFRKVCDAVSFAHRSLIVHRDLKASNILVTAGGSPKLLDFGIAKLLDPQNRSEDTAPDNRMLTLQCASPEQMRGETVTTSSDIYALGLLLFELLAGRPPFVFRNVSLSDAERIICQEAVAKPSSVAAETGVADRKRKIPADLDNITLMALRKDPARRYRSVDEFSEDIRRFQTGHPVIARDDTFTYRARKFLRRHGAGVALAAVALSALFAGIVYANVERRRAEVRLNEMLGMANQTLLDLHNQIERQPGSIETRLRLTNSTLSYLAGLANDTGNNQEVRTTLAKAYLATGDIQGYPDDPNLGDSKGALTSYQAAAKLFSPSDHASLGRLYWRQGVVLYKMGRVADGVSSLRKGISEASNSDSLESQLSLASAYHSLSYALTASNPEEALASSLRESEVFSALAKRYPANIEAQSGLSASCVSAGGALVRRNRLEEALALFKKGIAILETLSAGHPSDTSLKRDLMNAYARIGDLLGNPARRNLGDRRAALPYYVKAQAIGEWLANANPADRTARMDLAEIIWRTGAVMDSPPDAAASLKTLDKSLAIISQLDKEGEWNITRVRATATVEEFRGWRLLALGRPADAITSFERAIEMAESITKKDPTDSSGWTLSLMSRSGLCPAIGALAHREEAVRCARESSALSVRLAITGPDRFSMAIYVPRAQMWIGATYEALARGSARESRDWADAAAAFLKGSEEWQKLHGRADIVRYQGEIADCAKKAADCNHRVVSRV